MGDDTADDSGDVSYSGIKRELLDISTQTHTDTHQGNRNQRVCLLQEEEKDET